MPVIPSYLGSVARGAIEPPGNTTNTSLRVGEVKEIVYPKSVKSLSGRYIEYTVNVSHRDGAGPEVTTTYTGCIVGNLFGLGGDILRYTLRPDSKTTAGQKKDEVVGQGAKVLLLCVNGSKTRSIIIGGIRDAATGDKGELDTVDEGHNLRFNFNGVEASVNKDGDFYLLHKGPTTASGKPRKDVVAEQTGAALKMSLDGSLSILSATGDGKKKQQSIVLDFPNGQIDLVAASVINTEAPDGHSFSSTNGEIVLGCKGVRIGSANADQALMLGTFYRDREAILHKALKGSMESIANSLSSVATAITMASKSIQIAAGLNSIPMTGGAAANTPFSAASQAFSQAEMYLNSAKQKFMTMAEDIYAFERNSENYLSKKNFTDNEDD